METFDKELAHTIQEMGIFFKVGTPCRIVWQRPGTEDCRIETKNGYFFAVKKFELTNKRK